MNGRETGHSADRLPEGFTGGLAFADAVPVLFFCGSAVLMSAKVPGALFRAGAACCIAAGCGKVLWKLLIAFAHRNVPFLSGQLRFLMPAGFALMLAGIFTGLNAAGRAGIRRAAARLPSSAFFLAGLAGICAMACFAATQDRTDARANRKEQITNIAAQGCFFFALLLLR